MPVDASGATPALKTNWQETAVLGGDSRSPERITAHYLLEKQLASRLARAPKGERTSLYTEVYNALFSGLPDHPQHLRHADASQLVAERQLVLLRKIVPAGSRFVEIGAGDARVSLGLAGLCKEVIAVDVSEGVFRAAQTPDNFRLVLIDGIHLPMADNSVDFVYSNQLMEHLHPEDAMAQLAEIFRVLAPGGRYLCITPNRYTGPHDVSKYFDDVPTGFHLKEYTYAELGTLFRAAGFAGVDVVWTKGTRHVVLPGWLAMGMERIVGLFLRGQMRPNNNRILRNLFGICLIGRKA